MFQKIGLIPFLWKYSIFRYILYQIKLNNKSKYVIQSLNNKLILTETIIVNIFIKWWICIFLICFEHTVEKNILIPCWFCTFAHW